MDLYVVNSGHSLTSPAYLIWSMNMAMYCIKRHPWANLTIESVSYSTDSEIELKVYSKWPGKDFDVSFHQMLTTAWNYCIAPRLQTPLFRYHGCPKRRRFSTLQVDIRENFNSFKDLPIIFVSFHHWFHQLRYSRPLNWVFLDFYSKTAPWWPSLLRVFASI